GSVEGRGCHARGTLVAGLLRRAGPGAAAEGGEAPGGVRGTDAVFGVPLLADAAGDGAAALGADGTAGAGGRRAGDPPVPGLRGGYPGDARGREPANLAG